MENGYKCTFQEKSEESLSYNGEKIITDDSFNWGYGGTGPQNMASAIAKHYTNNNFLPEEERRFRNDIIIPAEKEKDLFISEYQVSRYFNKSHNLSKFQIIEQYVNDYANEHRKEILDNPLEFAYLVKDYLNKKLYYPTKYIIFNYLNKYFRNDYSPSIHYKKDISNQKKEVICALKIICKQFNITNDDLFKLS